MKRFNPAWSVICLSLLLIGTAGFCQDLTHPLDMNLPASDFQPPDPVDYQLVLDNGLVAYIARADQVPLVTLSAFIKVGKVSDARQGAAEALLDAIKNAGPTNSSPDAIQRCAPADDRSLYSRHA